MDTIVEFVAGDFFKLMRYIALIVLGVLAIGLGACAKDEPAYTHTTQTSASTGYHK